MSSEVKLQADNPQNHQKLNRRWYTFFKNRFNFVDDEENQKLPKIYWKYKLQKHPSKARFIIVTCQGSVKLLFQAVTSVMKLKYKHIKIETTK